MPVVCAACGSVNPVTGRFCGECGRPLGAACPDCGAATLPDQKFCNDCGTRIVAAPTTASAPGTAGGFDEGPPTLPSAVAHTRVTTVADRAGIVVADLNHVPGSLGTSVSGALEVPSGVPGRP